MARRFTMTLGQPQAQARDLAADVHLTLSWVGEGRDVTYVLERSDGGELQNFSFWKIPSPRNRQSWKVRILGLEGFSRRGLMWPQHGQANSHAVSGRSLSHDGGEGGAEAVVAVGE